MTDQEIIERVNETAWEMAQAAGVVVPVGFRFDKSHYLDILNKWRAAVIVCKETLGVDGQEALARDEAAIRRRLTG